MLSVVKKETFYAKGSRLVITGIIDSWQPSVHSDKSGA